MTGTAVGVGTTFFEDAAAASDDVELELVELEITVDAEPVVDVTGLVVEPPDDEVTPPQAAREIERPIPPIPTSTCLRVISLEPIFHPFFRYALLRHTLYDSSLKP